MTTILIPMAGGGSRFAEQGYALPKPLLPVSGLPMCIQAAHFLPQGDRYVFVIRSFQEAEYGVKSLIKAHIPDAEFIEIESLTDGQARTCLLADGLVSGSDSLVIGACDNGMLYNREAFIQRTNHADVVVFTFRNNPAVKEKPQAYGWVVEDDNGHALKMSVKTPISDFPMHDPAVVGAFWFKKASYFYDAARKMISENRRINGEFYVDECINDCIESGLIVSVFDIEEYIGWGTPNDYEIYNYWEQFFLALKQKAG